jgi:hypothetical protein
MKQVLFSAQTLKLHLTTLKIARLSVRNKSVVSAHQKWSCNLIQVIHIETLFWQVNNYFQGIFLQVLVGASPTSGDEPFVFFKESNVEHRFLAQEQLSAFA